MSCCGTSGSWWSWKTASILRATRKLAIVLTDEELEIFLDDEGICKRCRKLYMGHDVLLDAQQAQALQEYNIAVMLFRIITTKNWNGINMGITLANFQLKAIEALMEAMGEPNRDIILKSCTGSGKTIILTHFMDEYLKSTNKAVFVWLTPGKGNLELQSKAKMDKYIHGSNTKLLSDIMSSGFEENDACFHQLGKAY